MGDLLDFNGLQLVITFLPIYNDGGFSQDVFRVGPFWSEKSLDQWKLLFIDAFQKEFEAEEEIAECTIPSADPEPYDSHCLVVPRNDPLAIAREILDTMVQSVVREYPEDAEGPFLWRILIRLEMEGGCFPIDAIATSGPFSNREDIAAWSTPFIESLEKQVAQMSGVKLEQQAEEIIVEKRHDFGAEEEFLLPSSDDPVIGGQRFFSDTMQSLIAACNVDVGT